jgi:salicylate hydroxylase
MEVARFADGGEIEADIVIGADGIHSAVRDSLFGPIEPASAGAAWRRSTRCRTCPMPWT